MKINFDDLKIGQWFRIKGRLTLWQYHGYCSLMEAYFAISLYGQRRYFEASEEIETAE